MWLANNPDLNSVDYRIWYMMQKRVYQVPILNMDELLQRLVEIWTEFRKYIVDDAIDQWCKRLEACVHAERIVKEEYLCSTIYATLSLKALRRGSHSLPANYTMSAFPSSSFTR